MEYKVITGKTLEQYKKKFRNCRRNLVYYTKDEVKEFDKKFGKENNFLLRGRTWCLIGDTYYEMPSLFTWTWFRNLNSTVQIFTCGILGVGVVSAVTVPLVLMNHAIEPDVSICDVDKIEWSNKHYDKDGNAVITIKGKDGNVIRGFEISIDNYQLSEDDFTYNKTTGELLIKKSCLDAHKGKIEIKPLFEEGSKKVTSIEVSSVGGVKELDNGSTLQFTAKVLPEDAAVKDVEWSIETSSTSSNEINKDSGLFTAKTVGDFNIIAKAKDGSEVKGSASLKINPKGTATTDVSVNLDYDTVEIDDEFTASSSVLPENASDKSVTWISSDESVATIDKITGKIKGIKAGEVTIKAIANNGDNVVDQKTLTITEKTDFALELISGKAVDKDGKEYTAPCTIEFPRILPYSKIINDITFSKIGEDDVQFKFYSFDKSATKEYVGSGSIINASDLNIADDEGGVATCTITNSKKFSISANGITEKINIIGETINCNFVGNYNGWSAYSDFQAPSYFEINKNSDIIIHHYLNKDTIIATNDGTSNSYVNCINGEFKFVLQRGWEYEINNSAAHSEEAADYLDFGDGKGGNLDWKDNFADKADYELIIDYSYDYFIHIKPIDYLPVVYNADEFETDKASPTSDKHYLKLTPNGIKDNFYTTISTLQNKNLKIQLYNKDSTSYVDQSIYVIEGNGLVDNHDGTFCFSDTNIHRLNVELNNDTYVVSATVIE